MISRAVSLAIAIATNLSLAFLFYRALTNPLEFTDFIYRTGIMIFMIEFMSLHSSGMFFGAAQATATKPRMSIRLKLGLIAMYSLFVVAFAAGTKQWWPAIIFVASLGGKAFYSRSIDAARRLAPVAAGVFMLLLATFTVVFAQSLIRDWFPFPAEVRAARPTNQSGLFVDTPQTLMVWGILYFGSMSLWEIGIFRASNRADATGNDTVNARSTAQKT